MEKNSLHKRSLKEEEIKDILSYIDFFTEIKESDYVIYDEDHNFEYTPKFMEFIAKLKQYNLVENYEYMISSITYEGAGEAEKCEAFSGWMKEFNKTLSRPCEMRKVDITFIRRAFLTVIRMEDIFPGSWGIDVETGTWLKLLRRLKELYEAGEIELDK